MSTQTWRKDLEAQRVAPELDTEHLGGVAWFDAPIPPRWHRCKPQTRAWLKYFTRVERCACGSIRLDQRGRWMERNSRTRS